MLLHHFADHMPELCVDVEVDLGPEPRVVLANDALGYPTDIDDLFPSAAQPVAQGYSGYQFGQLSPVLGDGRAALIGEISTSHGLRDLHAKGIGPTPFARSGDGRATLRAMAREYLIGEILHAFGIPTSRAVAVLSTGARVRRTTVEDGAVLVRTAASHLRIGHTHYTRLLDPDPDGLTRRFVDYAMERHDPDHRGDLAAWFQAVMSRQATTVARWMRVGFVHGVMNTDNTTLSGESLDFGPCAFTPTYDLSACYSSIDTNGRYAFGNQPVILGWNLARLAESVLPIDLAIDLMRGFPDCWRQAWLTSMQQALGLSHQALADVEELIDDHHELMHGKDIQEHNRRLLTGDGPSPRWTARWQSFDPNVDEIARHSPVFIPRNHQIEAALGDLSYLRDLVAAVNDPGDTPTKHDTPEPEGSGAYITYCGT